MSVHCHFLSPLCGPLLRTPPPHHLAHNLCYLAHELPPFLPPLAAASTSHHGRQPPTVTATLSRHAPLTLQPLSLCATLSLHTLLLGRRTSGMGDNGDHGSNTQRRTAAHATVNNLLSLQRLFHPFSPNSTDFFNNRYMQPQNQYPQGELKDLLALILPISSGNSGKRTSAVLLRFEISPSTYTEAQNRG